MKRALTLKKEVLTELTNDELVTVVGGADASAKLNICTVLSLDLGCGFPTCGPRCTGTSDPLTK
jgi:hypothetical protein